MIVPALGSRLWALGPEFPTRPRALSQEPKALLLTGYTRFHPMPNYRHVALVLGALLVGFTIGPSRAQSTSAAGAATADKSRRPMTLVDLLNIPRVLDPQMNSDGERIAFTLRTADWPNNRRVDQIWQIRADGSALTRLTSIASGVGAAKAWSPDGRTLAFLARGTSPGFSIFLLSEGGAPRQLSRHATSIIASQPGMLAWAPDGSAIYFLAADPPGAADVERDKLRGDIYSYDDYRQQHLWKITVADGQEQRLTSGDYSIVGFKVSPDGSQILFVARANDRQEPYYNASLFLMPAAGGTPHALVPTFPYEVLRAEWAADGKSIWAVVNMGVHSELFQFDAATHTPRQI